MSYNQFTCPNCGSHSFGTSMPMKIGRCCDCDFTWDRNNETKYFNLVNQSTSQKNNKCEEYIQNNQEFAPPKTNPNYVHPKKETELTLKELYEIVITYPKYDKVYKRTMHWRTYDKWHNKNISIQYWTKTIEEITREYCKFISKPKQSICPKRLRKELVDYIIDKIYSEPMNTNDINKGTQ